MRSANCRSSGAPRRPPRTMAARRCSTCTASRPTRRSGSRSWRRSGGLAPDLPGFGRSGKRGHRGYSIDGSRASWSRSSSRRGPARPAGRARLGRRRAGLRPAPSRAVRAARRSSTPSPSCPALTGTGSRASGARRCWASLRWASRAAGCSSAPRRRQHDARSASRSVAGHTAERFDQGTQRAILRLYRSSPSEVLARAGAELGMLDVPALVIWGCATPTYRALRHGVRRRPARRRAARDPRCGPLAVAGPPRPDSAGVSFLARPREPERGIGALGARCPRWRACALLVIYLVIAPPSAATSPPPPTARSVSARASRFGTTAGTAATTCWPTRCSGPALARCWACGRCWCSARWLRRAVRADREPGLRRRRPRGRVGVVRLRLLRRAALGAGALRPRLADRAGALLAPLSGRHAAALLPAVAHEPCKPRGGCLPCAAWRSRTRWARNRSETARPAWGWRSGAGAAHPARRRLPRRRLRALRRPGPSGPQLAAIIAIAALLLALAVPSRTCCASAPCSTRWHWPSPFCPHSRRRQRRAAGRALAGPLLAGALWGAGRRGRSLLAAPRAPLLAAGARPSTTWRAGRRSVGERLLLRAAAGRAHGLDGAAPTRVEVPMTDAHWEVGLPAARSSSRWHAGGSASSTPAMAGSSTVRRSRPPSTAPGCTRTPSPTSRCPTPALDSAGGQEAALIRSGPQLPARRFGALPTGGCSPCAARRALAAAPARLTALGADSFVAPGCRGRAPTGCPCASALLGAHLGQRLRARSAGRLDRGAGAARRAGPGGDRLLARHGSSTTVRAAAAVPELCAPRGSDRLRAMLARLRRPGPLLPHGWLDVLRQFLLFGAAYLAYRVVTGTRRGEGTGGLPACTRADLRSSARCTSSSSPRSRRGPRAAAS